MFEPGRPDVVTDKHAVFHAIGILVLETIFLVLVNSQAGRQRKSRHRRRRGPIRAAPARPGRSSSIVGTLGDRVVGAGAAGQVAELDGVRDRVVEHVANAVPLTACSLYQLRSKSLRYAVICARQLHSGIDDVAELVLFVLADENVAGGCRIATVGTSAKSASVRPR